MFAIAPSIQGLRARIDAPFSQGCRCTCGHRCGYKYSVFANVKTCAHWALVYTIAGPYVYFLSFNFVDWTLQLCIVCDGQTSAWQTCVVWLAISASWLPAWNTVQWRWLPQWQCQRKSFRRRQTCTIFYPPIFLHPPLYIGGIEAISFDFIYWRM